jgi:hypothetical protein
MQHRHSGRNSKFVVASVAVLTMVATSAASASDDLAGKYCAVEGASEPKPAPAELAPAIARVLDIDVTLVRLGSFYRCVSGRLLVCAVGANLPCGRANVSRSMPEADEFCRANPNSIGIPMAVTGHDTVWSWRCDGTKAHAEGPSQPVDPQGYFTEYWKEL